MSINFDNYLDALYYGDKGTLIIGLTGFTGSGNSTTRTILSEKNKSKFPGYKAIYGEEDTDDREYKITRMDIRVFRKIERFWIKEEWIPFVPIEVSKIIFSFLLYKLIKKEINNDKYPDIFNYIEKNNPDLSGLKHLFINDLKIEYSDAKSLLDSYNNAINIYKHFKDVYKKNKMKEMGEFITLLQDLGDEIRRFGEVVDQKGGESSPKNIFALPKAIDKIIKAHIALNNSSRFVIDSLKNPFEIVYFKNMYSDFYLLGILRNKKERYNELIKVLYNADYEKINIRERAERPETIKKEKENLSTWITSQDIEECLKKADMYISNENSETRQYLHLRFGLVKLLTLINKPGCFTPSQDERCMQLAMTARLASGCISRQVGAVIIDSERRIIGVGWNDPPKTQIPCALRTCNELLNDPHYQLFSEYERGEQFVAHVKSLNLGDKPFCFRSELSNSKKEAKKAEFTRALHAEENALFQASRNNGASLEGSTLYTTSSTCTLCAKKAYQLGIERIVYIDEYYDIAIPQTLKSGKKNILIKRFSGIIGEAFNKLYTAPMPEKSLIQLYDNY
jgi:deoxycytidylate deaminase